MIYNVRSSSYGFWLTPRCARGLDYWYASHARFSQSVDYPHSAADVARNFNSFDPAADNKINPDFSDMFLGADAYDDICSWVLMQCNRHGATSAQLGPHYMIFVHANGNKEIVWMPLDSALSLCNRLTGRSVTRDKIQDYSKVPRSSAKIGGRDIEVCFQPFPHPQDAKACPCNSCGIPVPKHLRRRCGNCRVAVYCSQKCQRRDWSDHRSCCVKVRRSSQKARRSDSGNK